MPRHSNARQEMIQTAVDILRRRGAEATSFSAVLALSGAPRGSIYHHFPDGKSQLIEEATRWAGQFIAAGEVVTLERGTVYAVKMLGHYWRTILRDSDFEAGCPIVAVTVEGELRPRARDIAGEVFAGWELPLAKSMQKEGLPPKRARSLATTIIAAVEGAIVLARATKSMTPLDQVIEELQGLIGAALDL